MENSEAVEILTALRDSFLSDSIQYAAINKALIALGGRV